MAETSWATALLGHRDPLTSWPAPRFAPADQQTATVMRIIAETPEAVTLRMRRNQSDLFLPGQHFHIEVPVGSRFPALETYSVASSPWPDPRMVEFTVKEVPGGRVSPVLVRKVPVGATLRIEGPLGYLTWCEADGGPLALIAGGSGVAPLMSMIRYAAGKGLAVPMHVLYSSKDRLHTIYYREMTELSRRYPWLDVVHTFTADSSDTAARYHRRLDATMVSEVFAPIASDCFAYLCGPPGMVRAAEAGLEELGIDQARVMSEEWD